MDGCAKNGVHVQNIRTEDFWIKFEAKGWGDRKKEILKERETEDRQWSSIQEPQY